MQLHILTLNPLLYKTFFSSGLFVRAQKRNIFSYNIVDIRPYGRGKYKQVDDTPYGGSPGMLLRADVLDKCFQTENILAHTVLFSPRGKVLTQAIVKKLAQKSSICLVCPRYEGVDQRFIDSRINEEISLGDYVLNSGDSAALALIEAMIRVHPQFMNNPQSILLESFENNLLETNQFTKPAVFKDLCVPPVLQNGNHKKIQEWNQEQSLFQTFLRRPDLFAKQELSSLQIRAIWKLVFSKNREC